MSDIEFTMITTAILLYASAKGHPCPDSTYAVPVNLYKEIYNIQ